MKAAVATIDLIVEQAYAQDLGTYLQERLTRTVNELRDVSRKFARLGLKNRRGRPKPSPVRRSSRLRIEPFGRVDQHAAAPNHGDR